MSPSAQPSGDAKTLQIQPGAATATFTINEVLRGSPNTVVGKTDQVAGEITLDPGNPPASSVGTVLVDARGLATDDSQRNNLLQRFILATGQFQYVRFTPGAINGLPPTITPGATYPVQIDGQLTIKDVTRDVSFAATVTPMSLDELKGNATTTINRSDFGVTIPDIPFVAGVEDQVKLDLDFLATASA